ncbi:hypothetical protein BT93_J0846 [Corymbia citriodora subsp. variegata]|nr:hypothetical protein BT93_J0846 [Corymbia citriodora subsp. variegata]
MVLTWSSYLVANRVAHYAFGLITKAQFNDLTSESEANAHGDLLAFWAPFLLLHHGAPDTITILALEDNELWRAASYVYYLSLPSNKSIVPTILIFIGGIIKYIERTLNSVPPYESADAGPNYAKLMEGYSSKRKANIPASIDIMPEPYSQSTNGGEEDEKDLDHKQVIATASNKFTTFKGLLVDLIFSFRERDENIKFFRSIKAKNVFRVIEAELNYFYNVFYTKAVMVHYRGVQPNWIYPESESDHLKNRIRNQFRFLENGSKQRPTRNQIGFGTGFYFVKKKIHGFHEYDIRITYTLLLGAVGLEFVALSMLLCSNWTIALLERSEKHGRCSSIRSTFIKSLLKFKYEGSSFALHILHPRWSKSIFHYNLIDSRLERWSKWIEELLDRISLTELFDDLKSGPGVPYTDQLGEMIFTELKRKSLATERIKEICAAQGKWALEHYEKIQDCEALLPFVRDVDYGESLLLWHIPTELYKVGTDVSEESRNNRENSKVLSDYMLHLMIKQAAMMSAVAGIGQIRFRDTCAELDKFIDENIYDESKANGSTPEGSTPKVRKESVCASLLLVPTDVKPVDVKGDRSKSGLFNACILAKKLQCLAEEDRWKIMSQVWVELLGHAALHCRPYNHAQQLSKGGELVTLVWLLMVQLGLSEQFQIVEGNARAKLIVQK